MVWKVWAFGAGGERRGAWEAGGARRAGGGCEPARGLVGRLVSVCFLCGLWGSWSADLLSVGSCMNLGAGRLAPDNSFTGCVRNEGFASR